MAKLVFLGTAAAGFVGSKRQRSAVYFDGLLLDCGADVIGRLEDLKLAGNLVAILITHLHYDHYGGLFSLLVNLAIKEDVKIKMGAKTKKPKLTIYAPGGLNTILEAIKVTGKVYDFVFDRLDLKFIEVNTSLNFEEAGKKIKPILMDHGKTVDFGYLIETNGFKLFYGGDSSFPSNVQNIRADYLIHEATFQNKYIDAAKASGHSTAEQAAEAATKCGAKKLFLTHVTNVIVPESELELEAKRVFANTVLPNDMQSFELD